MSCRLPLKVENWRVSRKFNGSDHNTILYQLTTDIIEIPPYRNYSQADWPLFTSELDQASIHIPVVMNQKKLDKKVYKITDVINTTIEKCCPTQPAKLINKKTTPGGHLKWRTSERK